MKLLPLLLILSLVVLTVQAEWQKRAAHARRTRHVDSAQGQKLLRRTKRRWVLTTIVLDENDPGPFPKHAGDLFNDRAQNYSIKYLISGPGVDQPPEIGLFSINDLSGEVFVSRAIDREKTPLFVVHFDVADRMTGKVLDKALIFNVEVVDKNDNPPRFSQSAYNITIKETLSLDSPIFQVMATDDDKEDTPNSDITYSIISQIPKMENIKFAIDPKNGLIRAQGCFNTEVTNYFRLIVGARDNGNEPLSSSATVSFNLQDGNNNLPVFTTSKYELSVREGELKDGILRLKVEDKDTPKTPGWRATFKILSGNDNNNYNLTTDPETNEGILNIVKPLDFEGTPTKKVVVAVENEEPYFSCQDGKLKIDKTTPPSNVTLFISVIDANDAPVFSPQNKIIRETEGVKPGTVLGTFTATDTDKVPNKIRYTIAEDPAGWVTVDENTGVVTTVQELDRESPFVNKTIYTVVLHAIDDGDPPATGSGTVHIHLSDVNDNTPELVTPYMERCENQNSVPFRVEAADKDLDPYAGPFKFDVTDQSRSMKENWQVREISGNAVEVLMLQKLAKGNYTIPMEIYDRQGTYSQQVLNVRVCHCPDQLHCEKMAPASHRIGGGGIGAIIGALLFFLLAMLLLLSLLCGSGKNKNISSNDEGNQTLIKYNEEGGTALSQATPAALIASANGNGHHATKDKEVVGRTVSGGTLRGQQWETDGAVGSGFPRTSFRSHNGTWGREGAAAAAAALSRHGSRHQSQNGTWTMHSQGGQMDSSYSSGSRFMKTGSIRSRGEGVFTDRIGEMLSNASPTRRLDTIQSCSPVIEIIHKHATQHYGEDATLKDRITPPGFFTLELLQIGSEASIPNNAAPMGGQNEQGLKLLETSCMGSIQSQRLTQLPIDDDFVMYKPRVYAYEGDLERFESMESFAYPEDKMDFSFLDQFDPKFAKLEAICKK
ncbi:cadherin-like protein 26 [Gastrophryne carolinensis]